MEGKLTGMRKKMNAWGVTSDNSGHLFVCDADNKCVQMFSVTDGTYHGPVIKPGDLGIGKPCRICWCEEVSSSVSFQTVEVKKV